MIDLHTHTVISDGELSPNELIRRAKAIGVKVIALTDHINMTNLRLVLDQLLRLARDLSKKYNIWVLPGVEITHVSPELIAPLAYQARNLGAELLVAHGESIVDSVLSGTNFAAIEARVDILAHPGLLNENEARLAAEYGVALELSARKGHCLGNGRVASLARRFGAQLIINSDAHAFDDLIDQNQAERIALGAGLEIDEITKLFNNYKQLVSKIVSIKDNFL